MKSTRALGFAALAVFVFAAGCSGTPSEDASASDESSLSRVGVEAPGSPTGRLPRPPRPPRQADDYPLRADAPPMQQLQAGRGWRRLKVKGNLLDPHTQGMVAADEEIVVVDSPAAIDAAPIAATTRQQITTKLAAMPRTQQGGTIIVRKKIEDQLTAPAPTHGGVTAMATGCSDEDSPYSRTFTKSKTFSYTQGGESGAFSGSIGISGTASGTVVGTLTLHVSRVSIPFIGCESYWATVKSATLDGTADVVADAKANGSFEKEWHKSSTVLEPVIYDDWISIYGVPVKITVSLPIEAGIDVTAKVQAGLDVRSTANGTFNVTCTSSGCDGSKSTTFDFKQNNTATVGTNARAHVAPWAQGSVKLELYDGVADAKLGVRATLDGDFWGYEGNTCGSPYNNGLNDNVKAAALDARLLVDLRATVSLFGDDKSFAWNLKTFHAGFWDLLNGGSTALAPMVWYENYGATAHGEMRPCYPYGDTVHYKIDWSDGTTPDTIDAAPHSVFSKDHTYAATGRLGGVVVNPVHTIKVTAVNDTQDRDINQTSKITSRPLANPGTGGGTVTTTTPTTPTTGTTTPTTGAGTPTTPTRGGTRPPTRPF